MVVWLDRSRIAGCRVLFRKCLGDGNSGCFHRGHARCGRCQPGSTELSCDDSTKGQKMARGTVKWFNPTKGYGFIQPQSGGKDVFVHISAVEKAGLTSLNEGQVVEYEEVANRGKTSAENLKVQR